MAIRRDVWQDGTDGAAVADYMEMIEARDSCWVKDSTTFEWLIKCD